MAVCSSCGSEVDGASRFCTACGQPMAQAAPAPAPIPSSKTCPACGASVDASSSFCMHCGQRLASEAPAPVSVETVRDASPPPLLAQPPLPPSPTLERSDIFQPAQPVYLQPEQSSGGKFRLLILALLAVVAASAFGAWYFWGVETIIVCSPPNVHVFLDDQEITATSYGRYVIPHLSRKAHLLKVQSPGFADTVQRLDFPLTSSREWVNIKLVPSGQPRR